VPCSVCTHPEVQAITAAMERGDSYRTIEAAYGVNKSSVSRHTRQCLTAVSVAATQAGTTAPMGQPPAPAHVVNPQVHQEAMRIYQALINSITLVDVRQAVAVLAYLVAQVVIGVGDDRTPCR